MIDTSGTGKGAGTNPADFTITGPVGSQSLGLSSTFLTTLGDSLAPGQSISVHITGLTSVADGGNGATTFAGAVGVFGPATGYDVLYEGDGGHNLQVTNVTVTGTIGVGGTGHVQFSGPGTIGGRLDFSAANTGQYHNNNGSNVGPTSVNYNVAAVTSRPDRGQQPQQLARPGCRDQHRHQRHADDQRKRRHLQTVNGVNYRVFNVTSYSENDGNNADDQRRRVRRPAWSSTSARRQHQSRRRCHPDRRPDRRPGDLELHEHSGRMSSSTTMPRVTRTLAFHGIILAPNDAISLVNANLNGRVCGGDSGDMQIVSGDHINARPVGPLVNTATVSATGVSPVQSTATVTIGGGHHHRDQVPRPDRQRLLRRRHAAGRGDHRPVQGRQRQRRAGQRRRRTGWPRHVDCGERHLLLHRPRRRAPTSCKKSCPPATSRPAAGPTGRPGNTYYTVTVQNGQTYAGNNFDDYLIPTCPPTNVTLHRHNNSCLPRRSATSAATPSKGTRSRSRSPSRPG